MHIPINLNDYKEATIAPIGKYEFVITACEETRTKEKGKPQFRISLGFVGKPEFQNLTHFVGIPSDLDEPDAASFKGLLLKRFVTLFKLPVSKDGFDTEKLAMEMVGATANADVTLSEPDPSSGNVYNRLMVPRVKDEPAGGAPTTRTAPPPPKR